MYRKLKTFVGHTTVAPTKINTLFGATNVAAVKTLPPNSRIVSTLPTRPDKHLVDLLVCFLEQGKQLSEEIVFQAGCTQVAPSEMYGQIRWARDKLITYFKFDNRDFLSIARTTHLAAHTQTALMWHLVPSQ